MWIVERTSERVGKRVTIDDIKKFWATLTRGDSGIRIPEADFRALDIPGITEFDHESRAAWLRKLFPGCSLTENTIGDWTLCRSN